VKFAVVGNVRVVTLVQLANAYALRVVSPAGKETLVKLVLLQLEKDLSPIDVSEDGNVTEPKALQPVKAL